jgi:hypothetical protein
MRIMAELALFAFQPFMDEFLLLFILVALVAEIPAIGHELEFVFTGLLMAIEAGIVYRGVGPFN